MKILIAITFLFFSITSSAQILKRIKDKVVGEGKNKVDEGKNKVKSEARQAVDDGVQNYRAQFDSADFDYALLLSDNSGLYNNKKKGEFGNRFLAFKKI